MLPLSVSRPLAPSVIRTWVINVCLLQLLEVLLHGAVLHVVIHDCPGPVQVREWWTDEMPVDVLYCRGTNGALNSQTAIQNNLRETYRRVYLSLKDFHPTDVCSLRTDAYAAVPHLP
jgi:hypothetical protein